VTQQPVSTRDRLQARGRSLHADPELAKLDSVAALELVGEALAEARADIYNPLPAMLDDLRLSLSLRQLARAHGAAPAGLPGLRSLLRRTRPLRTYLPGSRVTTETEVTG